jgi:hypothetical protein
MWECASRNNKIKRVPILNRLKKQKNSCVVLSNYFESILDTRNTMKDISVRKVPRDVTEIL